MASWPSPNTCKQAGIEPVFIGAAADDLSPFRAFRTLPGAPLAEIKSLLAAPRSSSATIPVRPTWRRRSACPWW